MFETVLNWKSNFKGFETFNQILLSYSEAVTFFVGKFSTNRSREREFLSQVHHFLTQNSSNPWKDVLRKSCYKNMQQF
jgi:hypothetical protein